MNQFLEARQTQLPSTNLSDRFAALQIKASQPTATIWQPEAGDTLIGIISGSEAVTHQMYGQQTLMLVTTQSGDVVKVWLNKWLRDNLRGQHAEAGDLIALRFYGKKITKTGQSFNAYHLLVDKG